MKNSTGGLQSKEFLDWLKANQLAPDHYSPIRGTMWKKMLRSEEVLERYLSTHKEKGE